MNSWRMTSLSSCPVVNAPDHLAMIRMRMGNRYPNSAATEAGRIPAKMVNNPFQMIEALTRLRNQGKEPIAYW